MCRRICREPKHGHMANIHTTKDLFAVCLTTEHTTMKKQKHYDRRKIVVKSRQRRQTLMYIEHQLSAAGGSRKDA